MAPARPFSRDVCIIGGGGHVGLPLAITFAGSGLRTLIYDINATTVELIRRGVMPFSERGADEILRVFVSSTRTADGAKRSWIAVQMAAKPTDHPAPDRSGSAGANPRRCSSTPDGLKFEVQTSKVKYHLSYRFNVKTSARGHNAQP
jgi:UDP-glucose/GDP-mannose dehydrogenase family, NAD binding domain